MGSQANSPPAGPPWDEPIEEASLTFVDLEMTGLDVERDRVIEVCAVRVAGEREVARLETLVRPDCGAFGNLHVHGIPAASLQNAPAFVEILPALERILEGAVLVAHGAWWDVAFLNAEAKRCGRAPLVIHYLDTLLLTRRAFALPSHSLASLCTEFGITRERAHRAADDVGALREVYRRVVRELDPKTPRDLWHVRVGARHARPEVVESALRFVETDAAVQVKYRPSGRPTQDLLMRITQVRTDLDPPRVLGYLLPTRSRRELRADRILAIGPAEPEPVR